MKILWTKIRAHLIDDLRHAWRWLSVWLAAALIGLDVIAANLPEVAAFLPQHWVRWLGLAILVGRLIKQGQGKAKEAKPTP